MPTWLQKLIIVFVVIVGTSAVPVACTYLVILYGKPRSDRPTPVPWESSNAPNNPTSDKGRASPDNRLGTKTAPLVVEVRHPPKGDPETIADEQKEDRHASAEWWNKWLTVSLVGATIAPVFVLLYQGYWLRRSVMIAERALTDLERPWLFVKVAQTLGGFPSPRDRWPAVAFTILNGGRFPADIIECHADFIQTDVAPIGIIRDALHTIVSQDEPIKDIIISATEPFEFKVQQNFSLGLDRIPIPNIRYETFFVINIRYRGLGDEVYISDFSWRWDHAINTWGTPRTHRT